MNRGSPRFLCSCEFDSNRRRAFRRARPWAEAVQFRSCYQGGTLGDTKNPKLLIEGHIFSELPFAGNITTIYLDAAAHSEIHNNARKFATKHGAKLVVDKI